MTTNRTYFQYFDSLRFIAAIIIVFAHAIEGFAWIGPIESITKHKSFELSSVGESVMMFIHNLSIGVDLFFLLSGFLITYLLLEEKKKFGKVSFYHFYMRRIFRIWPIFILLIALGPVLVAWTASTPEPNYLMNALFLGNFETIKTELWIFPYAHFWSICIEEHFYLFWPFVVAFVPLKRLLPVLFAFVGLSIGFRIFIHFFSDYAYYQVYLNTLSRMDVLVFGAIVAYFYSKKPFHFTLHILARYALFALLIWLMFTLKIYDSSTFFETVFQKYLFIGIILLLLLDFQFRTKYAFRPFNNPVFSYLGKCSYGIYMYSNIVVLIVVKTIMLPYGNSNLWWFLFFNFSITLAVSIISFELIERPILKWSRRFRILK